MDIEKFMVKGDSEYKLIGNPNDWVQIELDLFVNDAGETRTGFVQLQLNKVIYIQVEYANNKMAGVVVDYENRQYILRGKSGESFLKKWSIYNSELIYPPDDRNYKTEKSIIINPSEFG